MEDCRIVLEELDPTYEDVEGDVVGIEDDVEGDVVGTTEDVEGDVVGIEDDVEGDVVGTTEDVEGDVVGMTEDVDVDSRFELVVAATEDVDEATIELLEARYGAEGVRVVV